MRARFGYYTPDEVYEATLLCLIDKNTDWLDVGCGHDLFPAKALSVVLSTRCRSITGIDPDASIHRNRWLHYRQQCLLEDFQAERRFDLISMRMVAEHIADPAASVAKLGELTREGGRVVVYTVSKWSPVSMVAAATPMSFHHFAKRVLWGGAPEDTFPTLFRMNTRRKLARIFAEHRFTEESFFI